MGAEGQVGVEPQQEDRTHRKAFKMETAVKRPSVGKTEGVSVEPSVYLESSLHAIYFDLCLCHVYLGPS